MEWSEGDERARKPNDIPYKSPEKGELERTINEMK